MWPHRKNQKGLRIKLVKQVTTSFLLLLWCSKHPSIAHKSSCLETIRGRPCDDALFILEQNNSMSSQSNILKDPDKNVLDPLLPDLLLHRQAGSNIVRKWMLNPWALWVRMRTVWFLSKQRLFGLGFMFLSWRKISACEIAPDRDRNKAPEADIQAGISSVLRNKWETSHSLWCLKQWRRHMRVLLLPLYPYSLPCGLFPAPHNHSLPSCSTFPCLRLIFTFIFHKFLLNLPASLFPASQQGNTTSPILWQTSLSSFSH